MRINEAFVDQLIEESIEEILESNVSAPIPFQILTIKSWVRDLEDDGPHNRAEKILFEHLEAAIDRLVARQKNLQPV